MGHGSDGFMSGFNDKMSLFDWDIYLNEKNALHHWPTLGVHIDIQSVVTQ